MNHSDDDEIRIQKWLSMRGVCSRREAERLIQEGKITLNGSILDTLGVKVRPGDSVKVSGKAIKNNLPPKVYYVLNKPDLTVVSKKPEDDKMSVFDLPSVRKAKISLFSVGRLDFRTEGLLILSNDGEFVNKLTHPSNKVPRVYQVLINGKLSKDQKTELQKGINLKDGPVKGVRIQLIEGKNLGGSKGAWYQVTVFEGRNRLVRRLFEHFDFKVLKLIRFRFGNLYLPSDLAPGKIRMLTKEELTSLTDK